MPKAPFAPTADLALEELRAVFHTVKASTTETLCQEILKANRICLYGVGREGLMMKAFAMRLFHLGLDVHVVGDMTTPPVGKGDLLMVSSGPGKLSTVAALLEVAKKAGARTLVITAQPKSRDAKKADVVIHLPAQTMANDMKAKPSIAKTSVLPMGSLFEITQLFFFEFVVMFLKEKLGQSSNEMRKRHTNLE
jgi:6-phospho-3-hexuloisomerase